MGSNHSLNRKEANGYGVVNTSEQLMNKSGKHNNNTMSKIMGSVGIGKENVMPSSHDIQLATAYLHKYANVSKRTMKTIMKPAVGKHHKSSGKVEEPCVPEVQKAVEQPAVNNAQAKCESLPKLIKLTSSHLAMKCLGTFVCTRYLQSLPHLTMNEVILTMKNVDRALTLSGWQDQSFLTTPNITFIYLLARESLPKTVHTVNQLKAELLTVLYMAYTYTGPEISYPLKPFLVEKNRAAFWARCCTITNTMSGKMLKIHKDREFYEDVQADLASYGSFLPRAGKRG